MLYNHTSTKEEIAEELKTIYFPVIEREVYFFDGEEKIKMDGYKAILGRENGELTQFAIVSEKYKLILNEDFFGEIYKAVDDNFDVIDVHIERNKGRFFATFVTGISIQDTQFSIRSVNSYDTSASTSLNIYIRRDGEYLFFDTKSFKHKHTSGNPYVSYIENLSKSTKVMKEIEWILSKMSLVKDTNLELLLAPIKKKMPDYMYNIISSQSYSSVLDFYKTVSSLVEQHFTDVLRQTELLKVFFESTLRYIGYASNLDFETEEEIEISSSTKVSTEVANLDIDFEF